MTIEAGDSPASPSPAQWWRSRRWIPFWVLQVSELALAAVLADLSIHVAHGGLLIGAAAVLFLMAIVADGPLGIFRIVSRDLQVHMAVVVAIIFAIAVWLPGVRADSEEKVVVMVASIGLIRVATLTRTSAGRGRRRRAPGRGEVIDATATVASPDPQPAPSVPPDSGDSAIRKAGRTTGAAAAAGKRAVDEHRPIVEDQVKRGLRGAGRLAGRLTGPKSSPDPPA